MSVLGEIIGTIIGLTLTFGFIGSPIILVGYSMYTCNKTDRFNDLYKKKLDLISQLNNVGPSTLAESLINDEITRLDAQLNKYR